MFGGSVMKLLLMSFAAELLLASLLLMEAFFRLFSCGDFD